MLLTPHFKLPLPVIVGVEVVVREEVKVKVVIGLKIVGVEEERERVV